MTPVVRRAAKPWSRNPTPGIAVLVVGIAAALFLGMTAAILFFPAFQDIDERISGAIRSVEAPGFVTIAEFFTTLGSGVVMASLTVVGVAVLLLKRWPAEAILLALTMAVGTTAGSVLKQLIDRARPGIEVARIPVPESYSFPSGHALAALLFFGILAFLAFVRAREVSVKFGGIVACTILALGVALSRVYLGVHFLGDVIASWLLGSALLTAFAGGYVWWVTRRE